MTLFGPSIGERSATFRLWAPDAQEVLLQRPETAPLIMERDQRGFYEITLPGAPVGMRYRFCVDGLEVPDPASRRQEGGISGWSLLEAPMLPGRNRVQRPWREAVTCEIHVGTATPEGTFAALQDRLGHFREAGYSVIELMPVAAFAGARNWGYDGVLPFAPAEAYGSPSDLRALVDAAHDLNLAVMLDVVYNHFGPEGNYLPRYAKAFFTEAVKTPWGAAINLEDPTVRRFFLENAAMWLSEYDLDGLRFDAVHAFAQPGGDLFLEELAATCRWLKPQAYLVLENDDNAARWMARDPEGGLSAFTAQWNDDIHHCLHILATGESDGYYADYAGDPVGALGRALSEGFVYQGETSEHRGGRARGEPSADLPPQAFVAFGQNHDQIGNRPLGDRLESRLPAERLAFLRFVLCLSPQPPLFFMGEEFGATTPFPFFCDFGGELGEAVRQGRSSEFAAFFASHAGEPSQLPDPLAPATFESAKLPWERLEDRREAASLKAFQALIELRRFYVWPLLDQAYQGAELTRSGSALLLRWRFARGVMALALNPSDEPARLDRAKLDDLGAVLETLGEVQQTQDGLDLGPWSAGFWQETQR